MQRYSILVIAALTAGSCSEGPSRPTQTPAQPVQTLVSAGDDGNASTGAVTTERLRLRRVDGPDIITTMATGQVADAPLNVKLDVWAEIRRLETDRARVIVDWGNGNRDFDGCGACRVENTYTRPGRYLVTAQVIDLNAPSGTAPVLLAVVTLVVLSPLDPPTLTPCTIVTRFVGNLNNTSTASTFETSAVNNLPSLGWTNVTGTAMIWDLAANGAILGTTAYGNYGVQFDTGVAVLPATSYTLQFIMGYMAGYGSGNSAFSYQLGTLNGGIFTGLGSPITGNAPFAGGLNGSVASATGLQVFTTGATVTTGTMAVRWAQTSSVGLPLTSDFFGIDNVKLTAVGCIP